MDRVAEDLQVEVVDMEAEDLVEAVDRVGVEAAGRVGVEGEDQGGAGRVEVDKVGEGQVVADRDSAQVLDPLAAWLEFVTWLVHGNLVFS